jgi:hypothetical protein
MDARREVVSDREQAVQFLIDGDPYRLEILLDGFCRNCVQGPLLGGRFPLALAA